MIKCISLKKQVKYNHLLSFFNNYPFIFVLNDLSLNTINILNKNIFKDNDKDNQKKKMIIKSKLLLKILLEKNILSKDNMFYIKGPVILIGVANINLFRLILNFVELKSNLNLVFLIVDKMVIEQKNVKNVFLPFLKSISLFKNSNLINLKFQRELLQSLLYSTYFIETQLMSKLKIN